MNHTYVALGVLAVLVLLVLGALIGSELAYDEPVEVASAAPAAPVPSPAPVAHAATEAHEEPDGDSNELESQLETVKSQTGTLQQQVTQLANEKSQLQKQLADVFNWMLTNYKGTYPLPMEFMSRLRLPAVTDEFAVSPEVANLLKITPEEEERLNYAFRATRLFLEEMQFAVMKVEEPRQDKVVVHIPSFADEGGLIREDLHSALAATLGPNRYDRFLEVSEGEMESSFQKFGEMSRTIVFDVVRVEGHEEPLLKIRDGWIEEDGPNRKLVNATETVVAELPAEYLAYIDWLPAYQQGTTAE